MFFIPAGQKTIVSDFHKARWQDMAEKAADKLVRREPHNLLLVSIPVVLPLKGDKATINIEDTVVGDGDTVGISAQILHNTGSIPEGWLAVDHPFLAVAGIQKLSKDLWILEIAQ